MAPSGEELATGANALDEAQRGVDGERMEREARAPREAKRGDEEEAAIAAAEEQQSMPTAGGFGALRVRGSETLGGDAFLGDAGRDDAVGRGERREPVQAAATAATGKTRDDRDIRGPIKHHVQQRAAGPGGALGAGDLAIHTIEDRAGVHQDGAQAGETERERGGAKHGDAKGNPGPLVSGDGLVKDAPRYLARDRAVQIARDRTIEA